MFRKINLDRYRLADIGVLVFLVFVFSIIIGCFYLIFIDSNPPIDILVEPVPLSAGEAYPGEIVYLENTFCKNTDRAALLTSYWQNSEGAIHGLSSAKVSFVEEGCHYREIPLLIPEDIPSGMWKRVNQAEYDINILVTRHSEWESEFIEILERSD